MHDEITQHSIDLIGAKAGAAMTYGGSGVAVIAGLSLTEWGVIVGIFTALVGLAVQIYFKNREDKRQERYWSERIKEVPDDGA